VKFRGKKERIMKNSKYYFNMYKEIDGKEQEFEVAIYPCNPRKLRALLNKHQPWVEVKEYDDATGKMKTVNKYCVDDKNLQGFGWADKVKPEVKRFFEEEKCDCKQADGVPITFDEIMDTITLTDNIFSTFVYGDKDRGIDGFFQKCNEATVRFK
jgi:hypothetical protein